MRHFSFLSDRQRARLFHRPPLPFDTEGPSSVLAVALGATLYLPATREHLCADIVKRTARGVTSMVVCLEDAIADNSVDEAEAHVIEQLAQLRDSGSAAPMVFLRVRRPEQVGDLARRLGGAVDSLAGFVFPKFTASSGNEYLDALVDASESTGRRFYGMPVLESREIIHRETRDHALFDVRMLLDKYREHVLAVRIGATDFSSVYGVRRSRDHTVYDMHLVAGVISDIVNVLGRADDSGFVVTGPVWEYFSAGERMLKTQLRESPFAEHDAHELRYEIIEADLDGLIREVQLDRANGLTGKTVIHPTHVAAVHALSVVTYEEFIDATDIVHAVGGGAVASQHGNKMNESKPHRAWAERTLVRADLFGVAREDVSFVDLLAATAGAP